MRFVPRHLPVTHSSVARLAEYIAESKRMLVLTGAGLSTESGLPDYRSEDVGLYARTNRRPINYQTFIRSEEARKRYWARNFIGWPYFSQVQPNAGHFILADWFNKNRLFGIITQNVDRLHQRAGSNDVLELHGTTHIVKCLNCGNLCKRSELQQRFVELNPTLGEYDSPNVETVAPDGDIELPEEIVRQFRVPACAKCKDGILKPDVVFFGENLPQERRVEAGALVSEADLLLCLGTSAQAYSCYRLVLQAAEQKIPVVVVNIGPTRGDPLAHLIVNARISETLGGVDRMLSGSP